MGQYNNRVAKWVEVNLGDTANSGSDTILRYALGGTDITHDGQTFKADGNLLDIGAVTNVIGFKKTSCDISFASTNLTILGQTNQLKYRNHEVSVWIGKRLANGQLDSQTVTQIFKGQADSHKVNDSSIVIKAQSYFARFEQTGGVSTNTASQKYQIEQGNYNVATTTIDKGFDYAGVDFGDITLGTVPARSIKHSQETVGNRRYFGLFGPKSRTVITTTEHIPGTEGQDVEDDGEDYKRPIVFGRATVPGNLIYANNPSKASVTTAYPNLANSSFIEGTTDNTKFVNMIFAIAEGEIRDISVLFKGLANGSVSDTYTMEDGDIRYVGYNGEAVAAIEVKSGKDDQTAMTNAVTMNSSWTTDHRCIGTALVSITMIASEAFADGFPDFTFNVGGKKYKSVDSNNQLSDDTYGNTGPSSTVMQWHVDHWDYVSSSNSRASSLSASPSLAVLDVVMSKVYGLGLPASDIDLASFRTAYLNETNLSIPQAGTYPTVCRGVLVGAKSFKQLIDPLLAVAKANLTVVDGLVTIIPNKYLGTDATVKAAVPLLDESSIIGGINNITFAPSTRVYNEVTLTAPVSNGDGEETYTMRVEDADALAEDNGQVSKKTLTLSMASIELGAAGDPIDNSEEVLEELGRIELRRSRLFTRGNCTVDYWTHTDWVPGTIVQVSNERYNLTGSGTILAKITSTRLTGLGHLYVEWQQWSNLIYDIEQTDITKVTRGTIPAEAFKTPIKYGPLQGERGKPGNSGQFRLYIYRRSSTTPTIDDNGSYSLTGTFVPPTGWNATIPAGSDQLWHSYTDIVPGSNTLGVQRVESIVANGLTASGDTEAAVAEVTRVGLTGTKAGSDASMTTAYEDGFIDVSGSFAAGQSSSTRDTLSETFDGGTEQVVTFDEVDTSMTDAPRHAGYAVTLSGFGLPASDDEYSILVSNEIGFSVTGQTVTDLFLSWDGSTTTERTGELVYDGSKTIMYQSNTATSQTELATEIATAYNALPITGVGTATIKHRLISNTTTYEASRNMDVSSSGVVVSFDDRNEGSITDVTIANTRATSTIENFAYVPEPHNEYYEVTLSGFAALLPFGDFTAGTFISSGSDFKKDGSDTAMVIGVGDTANFRTGEITFGSSNIWYASSTATSQEGLAEEAVNAYNSLAITGVGTTSIRHATLGNSATALVSRSVVLSSTGSVIRVTYLNSGDFTDKTILANTTPLSSTVTNTAENVLPLQAYTTSQIADRIVSVGYEGLTLTHDNTFDATANPLTAGNERVKFVYDTQTTHTDVTTSDFVVTDGDVGSLAVEGVTVVTQGTSGAVKEEADVSWAGTSAAAPGDLDSVSVTFDSNHATNPIVYTITASSTGASLDSQFKAAMDAAVTAGDLTDITVSSITDATKLLSTVTGERTDLTVVNTGGTGSTAVPTVIVQAQGQGSGALTQTAYTITASGSHSPASLASTFPNGQLLVDAQTRIRNHFVNGDIGGYNTPGAITSNAFDVTNTVAGADSPDLDFTITTTGTGGDLVATDVVQTQGTDAIPTSLTTATYSFDNTVSGPDLTAIMSRLSNKQEQEEQHLGIINGTGKITAEFINGVLTATYNDTGAKVAMDITYTTGGDGQTATDPVITQLTAGTDDAVNITGWETPYKEGEDGSQGLRGFRNAQGTVYYTVAQASAPATPSASAYDIDTGTFTGLTANWTKDPQTIIANSSLEYWQSRFVYAESSSNTLVFDTPQAVASFENLLTKTLTATDFIKAGNIEVNANATVQSGSGVYINGNGDLTAGDQDFSIVWDASAGTFNVNGKIITAGNIQTDGVSLVADSNGNLAVGLIGSGQVADAGDKTLVIDQSGADGGSGVPVGSNGGNGSNYFVAATGNITVTSVNTSGGKGGTGTATGGDAGSAGNVELVSTDGDIIITSIDASGGKGGTGSTATGGDGGNGGTVTLRATKGCITGTGNISVAAGEGGNGLVIDGDPGSPGTINLSNSSGNTCAT